MKRTLGRSGIQVSALGMGCWAIGGPFTAPDDRQLGWGPTDDDESKRALNAAVDAGITLFDTSDVYGCGHSERLIGEALSGRRDEIQIATKFSAVFDESTRHVTGGRVDPEWVREACEASLRRLKSDVIDLYQFHAGEHPAEAADDTRDALEGLVAAGKIRAYGWSTDHADRVRVFAKGEHCAAVQLLFNVFEGNGETLAVAEDEGLAALVRTPLGMGLLTGTFDEGRTFPKTDIRHSWDLRGDHFSTARARLDAIRDVLTSDGRTPAQGAIAWLWARSPATIPLPGCRTVAQVTENAAAMAHGPLTADQFQEVEQILGRVG